ncbi:MAG: bifunctional riboflavin kinase/FAD synthetase [Acidobacteriota bacterium]|nr:bifunctional riboflavin kinase/FAD synthetase [Acidobacteriota bacterium]
MGAAGSIAAIGNFDGVHRGHQQILARVVERARASGHPAVVATFDPHPSRILRQDSAPPLITTLEQKLALFDAAGLDAALVIPFTTEFARLTPGEFGAQILKDTLHVSAVFVGDNFRFGHRQEGDAPHLVGLGERLGFAVDIVPAVRLRGQMVSSTLVRRAVAEGFVDRAGRMLGRPFALTGQIQRGTGQGRRLVVPTLNLAWEQELVPGRGVYATEAVVAGTLYRAATNVGLRPTFQGHVLTVESHLLDFSENLAGGPMEVRFWRRLRDEKKFASPADLREQVLHDIAQARRFFSRLDRWHHRPTLSRP